MTALSFVWVHRYSQNSRCDINLEGYLLLWWYLMWYLKWLGIGYNLYIRNLYMLHRIKHSLQTKHKNSMWGLTNSNKRSAAGGSWSPGTNTMNQEEVVLGEQKTMMQIYSVTIAVRHCFAWQDI